MKKKELDDKFWKELKEKMKDKEFMKRLRDWMWKQTH